MNRADDVRSVRQEIVAAFADVPVPPAYKLIALRDWGQAGAWRFLRELSGRSWNSLSLEFLKKRWNYYGYLSAEAYRYYLPALLMASLNNIESDQDIVHSTLFMLIPDAWYLDKQQQDKTFARQVSLFSERQYNAVCAFLGLFFQDEYLRFMAAQALRWGWNWHENEAQKMCRAFYDRMFHYEYPFVDDPTVQALINQIRTAFAETPSPVHVRQSGAGHGDDSLEFTGLDWRTIHPDFLSYNYECLSFFTNEEFRYFLPAYLIAEMFGHESNADPVFHLTHGFYREDPTRMQDFLKHYESIRDETSRLLKEQTGLNLDVEKLVKQANKKLNRIDWQDYNRKRFSDFNRSERLAIIAYLEHALSDAVFPDQITQALDSYWRPSVAS